MQITAGISIEPGDTVTRQTIFDLWAQSIGGTVVASDLDQSLDGVFAADDFPILKPGRLWWDEREQLLKFYCDVVDGTGCSLWLSCGPDRFDIPFLATEPIPFGACFQLTGDGRKVKLPPGPETQMQYLAWIWEVGRVIGFNNNTPEHERNTIASGAWFSGAVDGFVTAWYPLGRRSIADGVWLASAQQVDTLISTVTDTSGTVLNHTGPSFVNEAGVRGGLLWSYQSPNVQINAGAFLTQSPVFMNVFQSQYARVPFTGPRVMRISF